MVRRHRSFPSRIWSSLLGAVLAASLGASSSGAQDAAMPQRPYAVIDRQAINYSGPDRETTRDLPGPEIKIGVLVPLQGARQAEGDAILQAARLAVEDESAAPLAEGRRLALVARDETGLWGRAPNELVRLVVDDQAVALVTSTNGSATHLAEQVGNRLGVPVLALSTDSTTTEINIPWFFRLVPDDRVQAQFFADDIYRRRALAQVTLVTDAWRLISCAAIGVRSPRGLQRASPRRSSSGPARRQRHDCCGSLGLGFPARLSSMYAAKPSASHSSRWPREAEGTSG
ncbi:MAG: ABC transporter substrate-binding protein [Acidobacteriia bacterium]|nr:ABC transporter substrate-binding protein [Terriglobia bacterium]